ncbi:hypothetical protein Avbf_15565 [Armadillidium vulgare]|nr:hypothetical protein Avbf_15565 [Armadillidium vulgare]
MKHFFPTNYSVLGIVDVYKSVKNLESHLACSLDVMKNKYIQRKDVLVKKKSRITSSLDIIENGLVQLNELTDSDSQEVDVRKAKKILLKLEDNFKKTEDFERINYWKLRLSVSISLRCFETPEKYLTEIYKKSQSCDKVFSVLYAEDGLKYGSVSVCDNKLVFHSLSLAEVPEKSSFIWFDELKQCLASNNFYTFIKICCNEKEVTHMMFDRHLCNQFIKLCTGECGPSYKGSFYKKGSNKDDSLVNVLQVENFIENGCETKRQIEYKDCGDKIINNFQFNSEKMFIYLNTDGTFSICRSLRDGSVSEPPFGRVVSPDKLFEYINYEDSSYLKVIDSGILFKSFFASEINIF